ncbi:MAG: transporter substrate-binding domain-containing protein [Alphaproteobacteria bacterium]|nr:transporter substrate-binding domain-containing protein [Alphaproteobacteria bacterium]
MLRIFCVCLSLITLVACGEKKNNETQKPLIVMTSPDNPPFEFKDTAQGGDKVIGFDMDVVQKLSERLGRPIQIVETDFSTIIPALQSGRADMALAAFTATDERRKSVDFSDPYYTYKLALLVPENSTISSEKDLGGKKIGAQLGSSHEILAQKWIKEVPGLSVVSLNKIGELVQELKNGRIEAIVIEDTMAHKIVTSTGGLKTVVLTTPGEAFSIAFPKGSPLVQPTNDALKTMKGDIDQISEKWIIK